MQATYSPADVNRPDDKTGTLLSVGGLLAWLSAMLLAIAGPLFGLAVPPIVIVGVVGFSAVFSALSLPKLVGNGKQDNRQPSQPR